MERSTSRESLNLLEQLNLALTNSQYTLVNILSHWHQQVQETLGSVIEEKEFQLNLGSCLAEDEE